MTSSEGVETDAWDELCWSPHEAAINNGRQEGHEKGLETGFHDGQQLGRTKGIEIGMELGYYRGFLRVVQKRYQQQQINEQQEEHHHANDRLKKSLDELSQAITEEFPTPDEMFDSHHHDQHRGDDDDHEHSHDHSQVHELQNEVNGDDDREDSNKVDVIGKMQRIRIKFKLLMRQLKLPHVTLQVLLAEAQPSPLQQGQATTSKDPKIQASAPIMEPFDVSDW